jgi:hypothetical protein
MTKGGRMTVLEWDKVGDRRYEIGIDRGVLFPPDGPAVPWNGLTSVTETLGREVKSYYLDGIKYLDHHIPGSYQAKLSAFTYPDELDELLGMSAYASGVFLHDQRAKLFHLSYRTLVGNDIDGLEHGYKIHIVYNVLAIPSDKTMNSVSDSQAVDSFEWDLYGTPNVLYGIRPTAHISLDSRKIDPTVLATLEGMLYGMPYVDVDNPGSDPNLSSLFDLLTTVDNLVDSP